MSYSKAKVDASGERRRLPARLTSISGASYSLGAAIATALVLVAALNTEGFTTVANLKAIMFSGSFIGIAAIAATVIMLSGSFLSLSLGTTISIAAMSFLAALHLGLAVAILLTLLLGAAIFGVQGLLVGVAEVNPIIVSIGAGSIQIAVATWLTGGENVRPSGTSSSYSTLGGQLLGLPFNFYVLVGLTLVVGFVLSRTGLGRMIYLTGENRRAAWAAGLPVTWIITGAFALAGAAAAADGILLGAFNTTATTALGNSYTYNALAATLVAGNLISGGRGSVWRTFLGTAFIAALTDMLLLRGYSTGIQILVEGVAVMLVVIVVHLATRRSR